MKFIFLATFAFLLVLSACAWWITPRPEASGKKIIVWCSDDNPTRRAQIDMFNKLQEARHTGYELRLDAVNGGLDKVVTQSLAGVGPDVFDGYRGQVAVLADAGLLCDLTEPLKARGVTADQLWPLTHNVVALDGKLCGVPCNCGGNGLWYHKDIFDAEGIPYPPERGWTWEEFLATAQKLTKRNDKGVAERYGILNLGWQDLLLTNGGRIFTPDGRTCIVDSPAGIDAVQKWLDLQYKYGVQPSSQDLAAMSTQGGWASGTLSLFQEKRGVMANGGRWWLCMYRNYKDANGQFALNLGVAESPVTCYRRFRGLTRAAFANALSPHRDRAIEFLCFLNGDEYSDVINQTADAMPGRISASDRPAYDYDPSNGRDGAKSPVWKALAAIAMDEELSPYISSTDTWKIINKQIDLTCGTTAQVQHGETKSASAALHAAAREINERIARQVAREPRLKKLYDAGDLSPVLANVTEDPARDLVPGRGTPPAPRPEASAAPATSAPAAATSPEAKR